MSLGDGEINAFAISGTVVLSLAFSLPMVFVPSCRESIAGADDAKDKVVIEASLAMRKSPKKQPQKQFRQPDAPDKPQGVSRDDKKVVENQCCTNEADCTKAGLPVGTTCPDDSTCENHRCKKKRKDTKDEKDDPKVAVIPDRTKNLDDPKGNPTENTVGEFDGSQKGTARVSSGDPWLRELANDFATLVDFPKIEAASAALACLRILEDGTIKDTKLDTRSDNDGLNAKVENALTRLKDKRKEKPSPPPTHLLKQVVTKWTCIPIDAQSKQD
jgi:hypothetical protein